MRTAVLMMALTAILQGCAIPPARTVPAQSYVPQRSVEDPTRVARERRLAEKEADSKLWKERFAEGRQLALDFMAKYSVTPYVEDWIVAYSPEQPSPFTTSEYYYDAQGPIGEDLGPIGPQSPKLFMSYVLGSSSVSKKEGYVADVDMRLIDGWWKVVRVRVAMTNRNGKRDEQRPPNDWYPTWRNQLMAAMNAYLDGRRPSK